MTPIERAIQESREREAKATPGPLHGRSEQGTRGILWSLYELDHAFTKPPMASLARREDAYFFQETRTYEPRFRDALEVAVNTFNVLKAKADLTGVTAEQADEGTRTTAEIALESIERILEGK